MEGKERGWEGRNAPLEVDLALLLLLLATRLHALGERVQVLLLSLLERRLSLQHLLLLEAAPLFQLPRLERVRLKLDLVCLAVAG